MTVDNKTNRRHSRWYELIILNPLFQLIAGLCFVLLLPTAWFWSYDFWGQLLNRHLSTSVLIAVAFTLSFIFLRRLGRFSSGEILAQIVPITSILFLMAFALLFFSRGTYSRPVLISSFGLSLLWFFTSYFLGRKYRRLKFAVLPLGKDYPLRSDKNTEIRYLSEPNLKQVRYDAIIADLRSTTMTPEWERFLAQCILAHIPVYNINQVIESYTGRVEIDHLSENELGTLLPSPVYTFFKRIIDILGVLLVMPVALPVMAVTAILIKLDSPGPALFIQNRVGLGDRDFKIFKFRSMRVDAESAGAKLAAANDSRITKFGHFIRKTRLDELPQLFNVLIGNMSLIGPRPEQRVFVDQFEQEIPFYIYRHVVRPGITGWAQVVQGYADDADSTRIKIQHDFYYIKNFSFWLDLLIVFKTIRILLTGWGAR